MWKSRTETRWCVSTENATKCPDVMCARYCEYGLERGPDGCRICRCSNPCKVRYTLTPQSLYHTLLSHIKLNMFIIKVCIFDFKFEIAKFCCGGHTPRGAWSEQIPVHFPLNKFAKHNNCRNMHTKTHAYARTLTHTHARMHTYAHAHAQTQTHT